MELGDGALPLLAHDPGGLRDPGRLSDSGVTRPHEEPSLIWLTIWSSVVHALVMAGMAVEDPAEVGHLTGDVPVLLFVAIALAVLMRRAERTTAVTDLGGRRAA